MELVDKIGFYLLGAVAAIGILAVLLIFILLTIEQSIKLIARYHSGNNAPKNRP